MSAKRPTTARWPWRLLLLALLLLHVCLNLFVLRSMDFPPASYPHFTHAAVLLRALDWDTNAPAPETQWSTNRRYSLMIDAAALLARSLGPSYLSVSLVSTLALVALLLGLYALAARLASERAGLVAAALLSAFPMIWGLSRLLEEQVADAALAVWTVYCALRLAQRPGLGWSIALCALFVLDFVWPKEITYLILQILFIGPAVLVALLRGAGELGREGLGRRLAWGAAAALLAGVLCFGQLQAELSDQLSALTQYYEGEAFGNPEYAATTLWRHPLSALAYYPFAMLSAHMGPYGLLCLVLAAPWAVRRGAAGRALLIAWTLVPWLVLLLMAKKQDMYALGLLPPLALLFGLGWERLPGGRLKGRISALALAGLLALCLRLTLSPVRNRLVEPVRQDALSLNVDRYDWPIAQSREGQLYHHLGRLIAEQTRRLFPDAPRVSVGLAKYPGYDFDQLAYCAALRDDRLRFTRLVNDLDVRLELEQRPDLAIGFWPSDVQVAAGFWSREAYNEFPVPVELRPAGLEAQLVAAGYAPAGRASAMRFYVRDDAVSEPAPAHAP